MRLLYFILGVLFVQYVIPLFDGITTWFLAWVEEKKSNQSIVINDVNIQLRQAVEAAEQDPPRRPIGFCTSDAEDYDEEEEDEDEV